MQRLPDGTYDVIVVDTEVADDGELRIEVAISLGPHVGEVVALRASHIDPRSQLAQLEESLDLLGLCGTLRVNKGIPVFRPERA